MASEVGEGPSTSSSPSKEKMEAKLKAANLLAQGKRNLICGEIPEAVQQFQDACQNLSSAYGEMAKECAEAYFHYGCALLDLSRMEEGVLGNALEGVDVEADDDEEPNNKEQFESTDNIGAGKEGESAAGKEGGSAEGKEGESAEGKEGESAEGKEGESAEGTEEEEEEEEGEGEEEEGEEDGVESQEDGDQKEDEDNPDDVPNLQLAWEMLELSKVIYGKDSSKDSQLKAAEACLKVGEVSLETEQYEQAISDYLACLKIQRDFLESSDRAIAETCYQLGLAYQLNKQQDLAIEHFKSAVTCLEETMVKLQIVVKEKPPKEPSQFLEPAEVAEKEIKELEQILPEIKEKIKDAEEESKMMDNLKAMAKDAMGSVFSAVADSTTEIGFGSSSKSPVKSTTTETGFGSSSKSPVKSTEEKKTSDISHLIRKKRKPGEETEVDGEDLENKKQKQEGASGDAPAQNGCSEEKVSTEAVSAT